MITYEPFWHTLSAKGISQYSLIHKHGLSAGQLSRLKANKGISLYTIDRLCGMLDCMPEDIIKYTKDT